MRLIEADALSMAMYHEAMEKDSDMQRWDSGCWIRYKLFERVLDAQPTVDAVPVRRGKWRFVDCATGLRCQCSECLHWVDAGTDRNYCPYCGAKMEVEDEDR